LLVGLARGGTYDLGEQGKLTLVIPKGWIETERPTKVKNLNEYSLTIRPDDGDTTVCFISIIFGNSIVIKSKKDTEVEVQTAAEGYMLGHKDEIVEKKVVLKEFKLKGGWGFYSTVTGSGPDDNPRIKDHTKSLSCGYADFPDGVRLSIVIGSDNLNDDYYNKAMNIVGSATLKPK
jgi:hypothetical protein